ncbi:MAG: Hpt domain-containing protein [Planctomycetes bacterium]|nr:Hpt domain-containing protein [Planctomycetota bacterium]
MTSTPSDPARPDGEPVDPMVLGQLRALGGDDAGFLEGIVRSFLAHTERAVVELRAAATSGDRERLRRAAHGLKGSAGNLGAKPLAALARRVEEAAVAGGDARPVVESVASEAERVRRRLSIELPETRA